MCEMFLAMYVLEKIKKFGIIYFEKKRGNLCLFHLKYIGHIQIKFKYLYTLVRIKRCTSL